MINHAFRFVLLLAVGIIPLFFTEIENKFELMIGWCIGVTIAYVIGNYVLERRKKRK